MTNAIQDLIPNNLCFGCGADNNLGLHIKSYWQDDESVCIYQPEPHQTAGPAHLLNGGIIATLIDCHCVGTALSHGYASEGREVGSAPEIWYATGKMEIRYLRPTPIDAPVELRARVVDTTERKTTVACTLASGGQITAEGDVVAIRVPDDWRAR